MAAKEPSANERKRRTRQRVTDKVGTRQPTVGSAPRAAPDGAVSGDQFRQRALGEDVELPSGLWCRARRVGMEALVQHGKIPNSLLPIVVEALQGGEQGRKNAEQKLREQMSKQHIADMMAMYDDVCMFIVVAPKVQPVPRVCGGCGASEGLPESPGITGKCPRGDGKQDHVPYVMPADERPHGNGIAYIDWIDFTDKVFLLNFAVGGTRDLDRFRQEQDQLLDTLSSGEGVQL